MLPDPEPSYPEPVPKAEVEEPGSQEAVLENFRLIQRGSPNWIHNIIPPENAW